MSPIVVRLLVTKANLARSRHAVTRIPVLEVPAARTMDHGAARRMRVKHVSRVVVAVYPPDERVMSALVCLVYEGVHLPTPHSRYPM